MNAVPKKRVLRRLTVELVVLAAFLGAAVWLLMGFVGTASNCSCSEPVAGQQSELQGVPRRDIAPGTYEVVPAGNQGTEVLLFLRRPGADSRLWCQSLPSSTFIVKGGYFGKRAILKIIQDRDFKIAEFYRSDDP